MTPLSKDGNVRFTMVTMGAQNPGSVKSMVSRPGIWALIPLPPTPQKNVRPPLDKILDFCPTTMEEIVRILNLENRRYLQHELSDKGLEVR